MKPAFVAFRKVMILSILLAFLANEAISFLAAPKIKSITKTAVYQFNESVQGIPATVVESVTKLSLAFILLQLFSPLLQVLNQKVSRLFRISTTERNPFYRHVSINAP